MHLDSPFISLHLGSRHVYCHAIQKMHRYHRQKSCISVFALLLLFTQALFSVAAIISLECLRHKKSRAPANQQEKGTNDLAPPCTLRYLGQRHYYVTFLCTSKCSPAVHVCFLSRQSIPEVMNEQAMRLDFRDTPPTIYQSTWQSSVTLW